MCCGACVDHPRRGPNEDASGANLLARAKLTERRVVKGGGMRVLPPFTGARVRDHPGGLPDDRSSPAKRLG
jgi:hypothetical protein